jgi:hypothetical protein
MRLAWLALVPVFVSILGANSACGIGLGSQPDETCNCPAGTVVPQIMIRLPCGVTTLPTLTLSGVCAGTGGEQEGSLTFGSYSTGTCQVELTFADGSMQSTTVEFDGEWLPCGSDPHGCGQTVFPGGLPANPMGYPFDVLQIGKACVVDGAGDAGTDS